ncbi:hypothetical protein MRBLBA21_005031 [Peribacillus frigoritolerans]|uniref:DUF2705 family protein n=1 Tax=Peribacillus frigoritolerans TaxID=450367 RepID=UPI000BEDE570|nr:DUF2705 family protein [Peribacillus frigoritolerans]MCR8872002.1 hypothetical protein [Peribacillus frigoritolerans]PEF36906.1 hypothetical protein CON84_18650 [Bacillus sp. AFS094228]
MQSHLYRIIHNKLSWVIFSIIILIPCIDAFQLLLLKFQLGNEVEYHPAFAFFLSGSTRGHAAQMILLWFLPLYFLLLGADDAIQDYHTGYRYILISKVGRWKYCLEKLQTSFFVSFSTMLSSLLVNFILVFLLFNGGTFKKGLNGINSTDNLLFTISMNHPYVAVLGFSLVCCVMAGFSGLIGSSVSLFFLDRKYAYTASFFIWFLLVLRPSSIMYLFQPFTEYDFNILVPILSTSLIIFLIIPVLIIIYEAKYNEN